MIDVLASLVPFFFPTSFRSTPMIKGSHHKPKQLAPFFPQQQCRQAAPGAGVHAMPCHASDFKRGWSLESSREEGERRISTLTLTNKLPNTRPITTINSPRRQQLASMVKRKAKDLEATLPAEEPRRSNRRKATVKEDVDGDGDVDGDVDGDGPLDARAISKPASAKPPKKTSRARKEKSQEVNGTTKGDEGKSEDVSRLKSRENRNLWILLHLRS